LLGRLESPAVGILGSFWFVADLGLPGGSSTWGFGALGLAFSSVVGRIEELCAIEVEARFAWLLGRLNSPAAGILGSFRFAADLSLPGGSSTWGFGALGLAFSSVVE